MNEPNIRPFTHIERIFAAENYEELFKFMRKNRLNTEEYHDALILHYMAVVQEFCNSSDYFVEFKPLLHRRLSEAVVDYKLECDALSEAQDKYFSEIMAA